MTDPAQQLTFLAWCRPQMSALVTGQQGGRASGAAALTLTESDAGGATIGAQTRSLPFLIAGPADITGLQPGAIVRRYPPPGTTDHESNVCPYIEVADPTLPWRYTPAPNPAGANLHPWLVLLTGPVTELQIQDGHITVPPSAQQGAQAVGNPADPYRYAHVQVDAVGHRTTRILSARPLQPGTDYLAVVVPAFDTNGAPAWHGTAPVTLPVYDSWQLRTAEPAGSFANLAALLHPGDARTTTGQAQLSYPRLQTPPLTMLGALAASTVTETALPQQVAGDLAQLRNTPRKDERGRPVVALPRYGDPWPVPAPASTTTWGAALNADPRHRGVAGLGLEVGIRRQEELVSDVLDNLGAVRESSQRIRHLALGVAVTRSLWQRRVPADPQTRLWLLGPALNRLVTATGTVGQLATADDRTPARGTYSGAARRVLRAGPARTASTPLPAAALLASTNRQPPPVPAETDGVPLDAARLKALDTARLTAIQKGLVDGNRLAQAVTELAARTPEGDLRKAAGQLSAAAGEAARAGRPVPWASVVSALTSSDATALAKRADPGAASSAAAHDLGELGTKVAGPQGQADDADLIELLKAVGPLQINDPPQRPLALDSLAAGVSAAFDPTPVTPPAAARVLNTIKIKPGADGGIDPNAPLAPPEPCIGLDRPAWADLAAEFSDWLLPGATGLDANGVVALQSNAGFIDAYLLGLNTQLLGELRWRNIPIATGCTPIRRFWDRADTASGQRADDIVGVGSWPAGSDLGDAAHRAPGATGRELVIMVRGELLLRYPTTLVYLRSAVHPWATVADFDHDPDPGAPRVLPGFHGRLGDDMVFFGFPDVDTTKVGQYWLVFEEPPAGYRFRNVNDQGGPPSTKTEGHAWAADTLVKPVRVLIRGDKLIPQG